eukprot:CAMPEP_0177701826 /NCGR_PEP_ID=MMETSP0484_2-20121128/6814_1 /TAXON_ID=354590 /ORGANISM="Rhodomonas lens, Strain RHODO" /LENGTH=519 /DNA_ID=CAMNT_0019213077 /DNA_START=34 /DNA_END=1593 /DNA_ORIENTATION=-
MTPGMNQTEDWVMINFEVLNIVDTCAVTAQKQIESSSLAQLPDIVQALYSESPQRQKEATFALRRLLCTERDPPIQEVINCGAIPRLLESLMSHENPDLQFEAAWALTNIASGSTNHTAWLVQQGVVPMFVQLLSSPHANVAEQAVWALGNIAGDNVQMRDMVIAHGVLEFILDHILPSTIPKTPAMLRTSTWALTNLLRSKPEVDLQAAIAALPTLVCLCSSTDEDVIADALWGLCYISEGPDERIQAVLQAGALPIILPFLSHSSCRLLTPALRTAGNVATGDDVQTQQLLDGGILGLLGMLLSTQRDRKLLLKEVCWTLSNILAGNRQQIQAVIESGLVPRISELASQETDVKVRREILLALTNALNGAHEAQVFALFQQGCLPPIISELTGHARHQPDAVTRHEGVHEDEYVGVHEDEHVGVHEHAGVHECEHVVDARCMRGALEGVSIVLNAGESFRARMSAESGAAVCNPFVEVLVELDVPNALEVLLTDENEDIRAQATAIMRHFDPEMMAQ